MKRDSKEFCLSTKTFRVLDIIYSLTKEGERVSHKQIQEHYYQKYSPDGIESPTLSSALTRLADKRIIIRFFKGRRPKHISYAFNVAEYADPILGYKAWAYKEYLKTFDW